MFGWPQSACQFPSFLQNRDWLDVAGRSQFVLQDDDAMVELIRKKPKSKLHLHSRFTCVDSQTASVSLSQTAASSSQLPEKQWHILSFTTQEW